MIESKGIGFNLLISLMKPLGFNDYVKLQTKAKAAISDRGTINGQSSVMGFKHLI